MEKEDLWYCGDCKVSWKNPLQDLRAHTCCWLWHLQKHQTAMKRLDIWTMPPFLIVHLKRFQLVNGGWRKSNKRVTMPLVDFDPLQYSPHVKPSLPKRVVKLLGMDMTESSTDDIAVETPAANPDPETNGAEPEPTEAEDVQHDAGDENAAQDDKADRPDNDNDATCEDDEPFVIDPELPLYTALDPHKVGMLGHVGKSCLTLGFQAVYQDPKQKRLYDLYAITVRSLEYCSIRPHMTCLCCSATWVCLVEGTTSPTSKAATTSGTSSTTALVVKWKTMRWSKRVGMPICYSIGHKA